MSAPSDKQIDFIKKLVADRRRGLTPAPAWLIPPKTSKDASDLIGRLMNMPKDPPERTPEQEADYLLLKDKVEAVRAKLPTMGSDYSFANSLVTQFDQRGSLSERQVEALESLLDRPVQGFYQQPNGEVVLVYLTRSKHLSTKTYMPDTHDWAYTGIKAMKQCTPDRLMDGQQVADMGRSLSQDGQGVCVVCLAEGRDPTLTDVRSIAAGYGRDCAAHYGWHYPTKDEAEQMLKERA